MGQQVYQQFLHYQSNTDPTEVGIKVESTKAIALGNFITECEDFYNVRQGAKNAIEALGSPVALHYGFLAFAQQLRKAVKRYGGLTLQNLAQAFKDTWEARGFTDATLIETAKVQGITVI